MQDWCIAIGNKKGDLVPQFNYPTNAECHTCHTAYAEAEPITESA